MQMNYMCDIHFNVVLASYKNTLAIKFEMLKCCNRFGISFHLTSSSDQSHYNEVFNSCQ